MPLSRNEIQKRSDAKNGVVRKTFVLKSEDIELIEALAKETKLTHGELIRQALEVFARKLDKHF